MNKRRDKKTAVTMLSSVLKKILAGIIDKKRRNKVYVILEDTWCEVLINKNTKNFIFVINQINEQLITKSKDIYT